MTVRRTAERTKAAATADIIPQRARPPLEFELGVS
jgi:hypothetical protein